MRFSLPPVMASALLASAAALSAAEWLDPAVAEPEADGSVLWYDLLSLGLQGRGWDASETATPYDRLPAAAEGKVPPAVWTLSHNSAGMYADFVTDATTLRAHWVLRSEKLSMNHMAATGVSGVDLYVRLDDGTWRWAAVGRPEATENTAVLLNGVPPGEREFRLYLPLYNGVSKVRIGVPAGSRIGRVAPRPGDLDRPVVVYGTSITQGGCASRPGMTHPAILGRRLGAPVINLGFSGSGRMEAALGELLAELDPALYVLECLPNMGAAEIRERVVPFVRTLRQAHPRTPVLLVEDRTYSGAFLVPSQAERNRTSREAYRETYRQLQAEGVEWLYYLEGADLIGDDGEGAVDGSHPTDLGFVRTADVMEPPMRLLLNR